MTSEKSEIVVLSSDTINSPEKSTDFELESDSGSKLADKCDLGKSIVISDTELEEGEINDEEEDLPKENEKCIEKKRKYGEEELEDNKHRRYEESYGPTEESSLHEESYDLHPEVGCYF